MAKTQAFTVSKDILGGTPVFPGTRVPVQTLLDYIKAGSTIETFLSDFPTVTKKQVISLLESLENELPKKVAG
jgi:uncharacterized protein (DUF433 family)